MKKATVSFDIEVPDNVTEKDLEEFLRFELGIIAQRHTWEDIDCLKDLNPQFLTVYKRGW